MELQTLYVFGGLGGLALFYIFYEALPIPKEIKNTAGLIGFLMGGLGVAGILDIWAKDISWEWLRLMASIRTGRSGALPLAFLFFAPFGGCVGLLVAWIYSHKRK